MSAVAGPHDVVGAGACIGCGSCVAQARVAGPRMELDAFGQLRPTGPRAWYRDAGVGFTRTCPFSPSARDETQLAAELFPRAEGQDPSLGRFAAAYVGHVAERDFRAHGSSGGMVSWMACELLRQGLVDAVAHVHACDPEDSQGRFFRYRISRSQSDVREGAGSRYYPVELSGVLDAIRSRPGRYAVVGIPCFIKAVQLLRREDPVFRQRIRHTLGLFCGHMKSARFVESLAWQMGVPLEYVRRLEFRCKQPDRPASWYTARLTLRDGTTLDKDWWHLADGDWGAGFFMDAACNWCDDVMAETADVSFGDAWVEPHASDWRGTNVVVVRSPAIAELVSKAIADGRLALGDVDREFVARTQAGGLRQRREGLAYRLAHRRGAPWLRKRVAPDARAATPRRRFLYRLRRAISSWSHPMFRLAHRLGARHLYVGWAWIATSLYHPIAYGRWRQDGLLKALRLR
jgi:coenzyme F420-reducing hydrogenase beta subunit